MPPPPPPATAWAAFRAAPSTLGPSPGARAQWHRGRRRYTVWVLRVDAAAVRQRAHLVARALGVAIAPVREADLHVTLWVAGFADGPGQGPPPPGWVDDHVQPDALDRQGQALRGLPAPRLAIGPASAFLSCAVLEVHPLDDGLERLRGALAGAGPAELRFSPYQPHLTVGRFVDSLPTAPLAARLAALRDLPPLPLSVHAVERVELDPHQDDPPLRTVLRVPLASPSPP